MLRPSARRARHQHSWQLLSWSACNRIDEHAQNRGARPAAHNGACVPGVEPARGRPTRSPGAQGSRECVQVDPVPRDTERMIKRDTLNIIMNPRTTIGVLTETEVLLVDAVGGKRVLRSLLLPAEASDMSGLVEFLWQAELTGVWVMPSTSYSRTVACAGLAQVHHWTTVIHRAPGNPERPACVLLWPRAGGRSGNRRLALAFPEHAGWGWVLPDAKGLLATVTYLDQVLGRPVADAPELVAPQLLTELTADQPTTSLHASQGALSHLPTSDGMSPPILQSAREFAWMRCAGYMGHPFKKSPSDNDYYAFQVPCLRSDVLSSQHRGAYFSLKLKPLQNHGIYESANPWVK